VKLSYADFSRFTEVDPAGSPGTEQLPNPFVGPNPLNKLLANPPVDNTPPVNIAFEGMKASGSFLFDTGAQASFISQALAAQLGVHYGTGDEALNGANPTLYDKNGVLIPNQFAAGLTGIGGDINASGFFLDSLTLSTVEGDPINFVDAPVAVLDVTVQDPVTDDTLTLDGDLGMNFFEPSVSADLSQGATSPFDIFTFDQPDGLLGLTFAADVPEPSLAGLMTIGGLLMLARRRRGQA
jgi:hypothetical protein